MTLHEHIRNPAWAPEATEQTDLGTLAHALLLEQDDSRLVVVEADDWRTKAARLARDEARAARKRPDGVSQDGRVVVDYKTTSGSAEPDAWARTQLLALGYDVQAAFGLRAVTGDADLVCVGQETEPPYAVSFVGLSPAFKAFAEAKRAHAVTLWRHCRERDEWPGYPSRTCWGEPPGYALTQWDERRLGAGPGGGGGEVEEL